MRTIVHFFVLCGSAVIASIGSGLTLLDNISESVPAFSDTPSLEMNVFVPEKDWKPIKPGQPIPPGLHVRMNLATGEQEAKLLKDPDTDEKFQVALTDQKPQDAAPIIDLLEDRKIILKSEIENALKNIDKIGSQQESDADQARVSKQFRSMGELQNEFAEMNLKIQSERDVIKDLIAKYYKSSGNPEERIPQLAVLTDLEYYMHQMDNAQDFVDMDGLSLIKDSLNSTLPEVQAEGALVLGAAMQNNPKVQISVMENGFILGLVQLIQKQRETASGEPESDVLPARLWYAMSALLRHFPLAQKMFLRDGNEVLVNTLRDLSRTVEAESSPRKSQKKFITLMNDLLAEKANAEQLRTNLEQTRQYSEFDLLPVLLDGNYCSILSKLLNSSDFDVFEQAVEGLKIIIQLDRSCAEFVMPFKTVLQTRIEEYTKKAVEEQENSVDDYFTAIASKSNNLLRLIESADYKAKAEL